MRSFRKQIISFGLLLLSLLPFPVLFLIADFLYIVLFYIVRYRTKVVDQNLRNAFPEKSDKERYRIKVDFYHFFADLIVECIKMRSISSTQAKKRWDLSNVQELERYFKQKQSILLVTGHYGNWEWGIHCLSLMGLHPPLVVYKPLNDPVFEGILNLMRSRFGAEMVSTKRVLRKMISMKSITHSTIFLADQTPAYGESNLYIDFLNQETLVYKGIERIAKLTGYPIVFCHIDRPKRGYYSCRFDTIVEYPKAYEDNKITYLYNNFLESIIREKPALWLWSHKRWKHKRAHESS